MLTITSWLLAVDELGTHQLDGLLRYFPHLTIHEVMIPTDSVAFCNSSSVSTLRAMYFRAWKNFLII